MADFITREDAALLIGCSQPYVSVLLKAGKLKGKKLHERAWMVDRKSAIQFRDSERKMGRPPKSAKKSRRQHKTAS